MSASPEQLNVIPTPTSKRMASLNLRLSQGMQVLIAGVCVGVIALTTTCCGGEATSQGGASAESTGATSETSAGGSTSGVTGSSTVNGAPSASTEAASTASTGGTSATSAVTTGTVDSGSGGAEGVATDGLTDVEEDFESDETFLGLGVWMGTGIEDAVPLEESERPDSRSSLALHISGTAAEDGVDVMWHTAFPVEAAFRAVTFWARSGLAQESSLFVTVGGPYEVYWEHLADGYDWSSEELTLASQWQQFRVDFDALGFGPEGEPSPCSDPFGAVHFILAPNAEYDFWLDDVVFIVRRSE